MNRPKLIPALLVPFAMMASGFAGMASRMPKVAVRMHDPFSVARWLQRGPPGTSPAAPQAPRNRTRAQRRAARRKKIARGHR